MTPQWMLYWSWMLSILGIGCQILIGLKPRWGWLVAATCQLPWFAYSIITKQYGFMLAAFMYTLVFIINHVRLIKQSEAK